MQAIFLKKDAFNKNAKKSRQIVLFSSKTAISNNFAFLLDCVLLKREHT